MWELKISALSLLLLLGALGSAQGQNRDALSSLSLSGRVMEEDGQIARELVQVDLVCNGRLRQQTLTKPDGTFVFDMNSSLDEGWLDPGAGGSARGAMEGTARVASAGGSIALDEVPSMGRGRAALAGCEVRVTPKPGLSSNTIPLRTRGSFDNPDIGVLVLKRLDDASATTVSVSTLKAPEKALESFNKAQEQLAKPKPNLGKAVKELAKATREYPEFSAAWDLLARVQLSQGKTEEGRQSFLRAVESEPGFISPYLGLAQLGVQEANWQESSQLTEKVLEMDSSNLQALYWHGLSSYYLSRHEDAVASLARLYERPGSAESYPFGLLPLGVIYATQGKVPEAAAKLTSYLELMPEDQVPPEQRLQLQQQLTAWESEGLIAPAKRPSNP